MDVHRMSEGRKTDGLWISSISLKDVLWMSFGYPCAIWDHNYIFNKEEIFINNVDITWHKTFFQIRLHIIIGDLVNKFENIHNVQNPS
jgi:hypothetical protein